MNICIRNIQISKYWPHPAWDITQPSGSCPCSALFPLDTPPHLCSPVDTIGLFYTALTFRNYAYCVQCFQFHLWKNNFWMINIISLSKLICLPPPLQSVFSQQRSATPLYWVYKKSWCHSCIWSQLPGKTTQVELKWGNEIGIRETGATHPVQSATTVGWRWEGGKYFDPARK